MPGPGAHRCSGTVVHDVEIFNLQFSHFMITRAGRSRKQVPPRDTMAKTIMIIDDSASLRQVVAIALGAAGYEVIEACDGRDALAKLDGPRIHVLICDVNMPNLDGIGFLKALRALPAHRFSPVIMLSTEAGEDRKREGQAAGARAWVVKPFKPEQLLLAVARLILP